MKRKIWILILGMLLSGCQKATAPSQATASITIQDDLQREVTIDSCERVAALLGSYADLWLLAGGEIVATADDAWEDFALPLEESVVNLGMTKNLSFEKLLEADPDLVLASSNTAQNVEWMENLEALKIPVLYVEVSDFEDYLRVLKMATELTGREDLYQKNGLELKENIEATLAQSQQRVQQHGAPTVLSLRASASSIRAKNSQNNILGEMLQKLGCINIADRDESLLENLSLEQILLADPDYIFFVQQGDDSEGTLANIEQFIQENPAWSTLTAVQEDRVYLLDKALYGLKPNARWDEAYANLEAIFSHE